MSFRNFDSKRELFARQDYTRAVVQKRDLLARRIKGDDKKVNLDINKVIAEINKGNLAVLVELDKAGIAYTLTDNSQAFDGKSGSQTVTFKIGETTYTATYEGKTKEQEEAEKKQKESGTARLESFLDRYYENVNTKDNTDSNTCSTVTSTQSEPDESVQPQVSDVTPTTTSQASCVDVTKPTTSSTTAEAATVSAPVSNDKNTTVSVDNANTDELDDLYEITKDALNQQKQLYYNELENVINAMNDSGYMDSKYFDTIKKYLSSADIEYSYNYIENGEYPAHTETLKFTYNGNDYVITYQKTNETRTVDDISDELAINPKDSSDYSNVFVYDLEYFMSPLLDNRSRAVYSYVTIESLYANLDNMRKLLSCGKELKGSSFNEALAIILREYYGITSNSTNEEFIEKIKKYISDTGANYNQIVYRMDVYYGDIQKNQRAFLFDLLEKVPEYKNCLKQRYIDVTSESCTNSGSITVTPSESYVIDEYDYEARLEKNIQQLTSGEYNNTSELLDILNKIQYNLDMAGIKYEKSLYGSVIHFTYNGIDYEICFDREDIENTVIKNTRAAADVTEEDIDKVLRGNNPGYALFWYGDTGNAKWVPEYDKNWREEVVRYTNLSYRYEGDTKTAYMYHAITNYLIELLKEKCGIEDYKASKDANLEAFTKYLESIDAMIYDKNGKPDGFDWYKINKMLYDKCTEFRDYVISIAIGPEKTYIESNEYIDKIIVRTRPTQGNLEPISEDADNSTSMIRDPNEKNGYTDVYNNSTVYVVIDPWHVVRKDEL